MLTPAAEGTALVAGGAAHLLQTGHSDVQDTAYVSTGVCQSAHQGTQRYSDTAVIGCSVSRCAGKVQTILQLCCTCNLELCLLLSSTVTLCVYLSRLKTHLFNTAYSQLTCSASTSSCGIMALYKCMIVVIIIIIIIVGKWRSDLVVQKNKTDTSLLLMQ